MAPPSTGPKLTEAQARRFFAKVLGLPDPGGLAEFSPTELFERREDLSAVEWKPATGNRQDDGEVEKTYRTLCSLSEKLRRGIPTPVNGYLLQVPSGGEMTVTIEKGKHQHERVLLAMLLTFGYLLRRCKRTGCDKPLFVRNRRQEYCSTRCSGLARIRKHRSTKTTKRVATGSQP